MSTSKELDWLKLKLSHIYAEYNLRPNNIVLTEQAALVLHGSNFKCRKIHIYVTTDDFNRIRKLENIVQDVNHSNTYHNTAETIYFIKITKPLPVAVRSNMKCLSLDALSEYLRYKASNCRNGNSTVYFTYIMRELTSLRALT